MYWYYKRFGSYFCCVYTCSIRGGGTGRFIAELGSFAVPFFFMVSGYFSFNADRCKLKKSITHISQLIIITYIINLFRIFIENSFSISESIAYFKDNIFSLKHILMWLILNTTYISGVAWFLFALLYCYILAFIFNDLFNSTKVFFFISLCFCVGIVAQVVLPIFKFSAFGINNAWLCGIPYFLTGKYLNYNKHNIYTGKCLVIIICGILLKLLGFFSTLGLGYLGNMIMVPALFALAIQHSNFNIEFLSKLGSKYAFFIYIMHPVFMHIFDAMIVNGSEVIKYVFRPIIVLCATIISAILFYYIKEVLANGVNKRTKRQTNRVDWHR